MILDEGVLKHPAKVFGWVVASKAGYGEEEDLMWSHREIQVVGGSSR
jgi:hypothetical protein